MVNVACSLASSSPLDRRVKGSMMTDLLHIIGIVPYDKKVVKS
jgi:tubulin polyglutamylase TTLL4